MGTTQMGVDLVLAWPTAQIGKLDPEEAVSAIYAGEIAKAENPEKLRQKMAREFAEKYNTLYHAGRRELFEDIIDPRQTRSILAKALDWSANKSEVRPWRKHGNIPL